MAAIDREFDYAVPDGWRIAPPSQPHPGGANEVGVGTMVRVSLAGRRVGGWVTEVDVEPPVGVDLLPLAKVTGSGPAPEILDLVRWAAHRWAGRRATLLATASPTRAVRALPTRVPLPPSQPPPPTPDHLVSAFSEPLTVLAWPPGLSRVPLVEAAISRGNVLVLTPGAVAARRLAVAVRRSGATVALLPGDWALAASGASVIGTRSAVWAPVRDLAAVVVLDEHDERYREERAPTWNAREVAVERARRAGVPCVLASPVPSLEARTHAPAQRPSRAVERSHWPPVEVVDRRLDEPGQRGLFSGVAARRVREAGRIVCVLNRTGRARLLACSACGDLCRCDRCGTAMVQGAERELECRSCEEIRPAFCAACGATKLKLLRLGVSRAREELEALVREPVVELTASSAPGTANHARVVIGTTAVLHQVERADLVAFLDFDQELLAARYRAAAQAHALLARAAMLVRGDPGGRLLLQTRLADHVVIQAALRSDPDLVAEADAEQRRSLGLPPFSAMALVSGPMASAFMESFGRPEGIDVMVDGDRWLVRGTTHDALAEALAATTRPPGRLRVEVDPVGV